MEKLKRGRKKGQYSYPINTIEDAHKKPPKNNLTGQTFGRLKVTNKYQRKGKDHSNTRIHWLCKCSCGNKVWIQASTLLHNITHSCGCLRREKAKFNFPHICPHTQDN